MLEQLLCEIRSEIQISNGQRRSGYNGGIDELLADVLDKLKIKETLKEKVYNGYESIENGFKSLVHGISLLRHGMSDAHNISYAPSQKDALLAVNTAKTIANFIVKVYFEKFVNAA